MRILLVSALALMSAAATSQAQDVRGVLDNLNRAVNPQSQQQDPSRDRERQIRGEEERYWREYYGNRDDWRDRQGREFGSRDRDRGDRQQSRLGDRDTDRIFSSEGARRLEYRDLSDSERRRYDNASSSDRRRMDDDLADGARQRWQRMSESERDRYLDDVRREEGRLSGSSSPDRRDDRRR